jgi:hypothetical protein
MSHTQWQGVEIRAHEDFRNSKPTPQELEEWLAKHAFPGRAPSECIGLSDLILASWDAFCAPPTNQ